MFILIIFLVLHVCVNAKYYEVGHPHSQNNIFKKLSPKSGIDLKTLKHLAKIFPNHAIEIEIQGHQDDVRKKQHRHMKNYRLRDNHHIYPKWSYGIGRSGENTYLDPSLLANAAASKLILSTTTTKTTATTMTTKVETPTTSVRYSYPHQPTDEPRRPLYMEDLIQALEDFEKKLATKVDHGGYYGSSTTDGADLPVVKKDLWDLEKHLKKDLCPNADHESRSQERPTIPLTDNRNMAVKNLHDVVRLINKGVKVQLEVTTPRRRDSNLKWVPIKVPREII